MTRINYTDDAISFTKSLSGKEINEELEILEVPSVKKAVALFHKPWFLKRFYRETKSIAITLHINEPVKLEEASAVTLCEFTHRPILISFESSESIYLFWKINDFKASIILAPQGLDLKIIEAFIKKLLISELKAGGTGVKNAKLNEIRDQRGYNLLMIAVEEKNNAVVDFLLAHNFEIEFESNGKTASSLAMENKHFLILHKLLNSNALFPVNFIFQFYHEMLPQDIIDFIDESKSLHAAITSNNLEGIEEVLERNRLRKNPLRYFYNTENISAPFWALELSKFDIYKMFTDNKITIGPSEDFSSLWINFPDDIKKHLNKMHHDNDKDLPERHLDILIAKTKVSVNNDSNLNQKNLVKEAYKTINKNKIVRLLLIIASMCMNLDITFDFNNESTIYSDPMTPDDGTSGLFYPNGRIVIAAKKLLNKETKHEVYGVIAHEFCHLAMNLVFRNLCKPYTKGNEGARLAYQTIMQLCESKKNFNEIIGVVFNTAVYKKKCREAELIVRVPQLYACSINNPESLKAARIEFSDLFSMFENKIVPILEKSLAVLRKLQDPRKEIRWVDLTDELKITVKTPEIVFQGIKVKINQILLDNSTVYEQLTSEEIKNFIHGKTTEIGHKLLDVDSYIQRRFLLQIPDAQPLSFDELLENSPDQLKILIEKPGEGKSTFFAKAALDLKRKYPQKWVILIDLKKVSDLVKPKEKWSLDEIKCLLIQNILNISNLSLKIFNELFDAGNVIILWDSVENDTVFNIIKTLVNLSSNQQWIASGPAYFNDLEKYFKQKSFKFIAFNDKEAIKLIDILILKKIDVNKNK